MYKCIAVSTNHNGFGLHSHILINKLGHAFELHAHRGPSFFIINKGDEVDWPNIKSKMGEHFVVSLQCPTLPMLIEIWPGLSWDVGQNFHIKPMFHIDKKLGNVFTYQLLYCEKDHDIEVVESDLDALTVLNLARSYDADVTSVWEVAKIICSNTTEVSIFAPKRHIDPLTNLCNGTHKLITHQSESDLARVYVIPISVFNTIALLRKGPQEEWPDELNAILDNVFIPENELVPEGALNSEGDSFGFWLKKPESKGVFLHEADTVSVKPVWGDEEHFD